MGDLIGTVFRRTFVQVEVVTLMLIVGALLYVFKQKQLLLYGLSEAIVAIVANVALLERMAPTDWSRFDVATQDIIYLSVFTYLLSRGVGNMIEGLDGLRVTRRAELDALIRWRTRQLHRLNSMLDRHLPR